MSHSVFTQYSGLLLFVFQVSAIILSTVFLFLSFFLIWKFLDYLPQSIRECREYCSTVQCCQSSLGISFAERDTYQWSLLLGQHTSKGGWCRWECVASLPSSGHLCTASHAPKPLPPSRFLRPCDDCIEPNFSSCPHRKWSEGFDPSVKPLQVNASREANTQKWS